MKHIFDQTMVKKWAAGFLVVVLIVGITMTASAHDGWTQTNTPIVEPGEVVYVELLFGNHSNDHASYRIEGTWNAEDTDVHVYPPEGNAVDISGTLFYTGELDEVDDDVAGVNNYYIGSFESSLPGIYVISAERDSVFSHGESASRTLRSAKSFVAVTDLPLFSEAAQLDGYNRTVTEDRAEFVPQFNPTAVSTGETVQVQLMLEGEPLADEDVALIQRSTSDAEWLTSDADGMVEFTTGAADYYLLRAQHSVEEESDEVDTLNYEATMTFHVQNGSGLTQSEVAERMDAVEGENGTENNAANNETQTESPSSTNTEASQTESEQDNGHFLTNPFFYVSAVLALLLLGSIIMRLRK